MARKINEPNQCKFCGENHFKEGDYCSITCGYRSEIANEYHCPVCNSITFDLGKDPYCSKEHRKKAVSEYDHHRSCRVCGSMFHGTRFDYTCSDYCKKRDEL